MAEFDLLWHLATLLLSDQKLSENADKMAEVEQTIARIRKTRGQPAAADYLEARLLIQSKEWAKAAALLERTRPALAAQQAHADLIGQIDLCLGQCDWRWRSRPRPSGVQTRAGLGPQPGGGPPRPGRGVAGPRPGRRGAGPFPPGGGGQPRIRAKRGWRWRGWRSCASCNRTTPAALDEGLRGHRPGGRRHRAVVARGSPTRRCFGAKCWRSRTVGTTPRRC